MAIIKAYDLGTLSGKQNQYKDQAQSRINSEFQALKSQFESMMRSTWRDDSGTGGLTIQQKFDAFGADAAQLFSIAQATAQMLVAIDLTYSPLTPGTLGHTFTVNGDGTVTVNS